MTLSSENVGPSAGVRPIRGNNDGWKIRLARNTPHNMDGFTLAVLLQDQDAGPLVIGRVLFHHGALSGSVNDIPHKNTIGRTLIIPVIRDEYLLSRYQVENTVKDVTHQ